jgi:voltage-dependent potassium channel beta subunit
MEFRYLGSSGLKVSALSLGSWITFGIQKGPKEAYDCMKTAFDMGCNFFDCAEGYGAGNAETIMGEVLHDSGWKRSDYILSTKLFFGGSGVNDVGLSRKHIVEGIDASLSRLQTDYVDLIYCHRPDIHTPIDETIRAMNYVINSGKALYWGTSEWSACQIMEAYFVARKEHLIPPTMEQAEYNMFHRERVEKEYVPLYERFGMGMTTYSPLASGILSGKHSYGRTLENTRFNLEEFKWLREKLTGNDARESFQKLEKISSIATDLGCTTAQLALAWCLTNPQIHSVVTGASVASQVQENMEAINIAERLTLDWREKIELVLNNKPTAEKNWRPQ